MKDELKDWFKGLTKTQQKDIMSENRDSVVYFGSRGQTEPAKWFSCLHPLQKKQVHNTYHLVYKKKSKEEKKNGSNRIPREHGNPLDID